MIMKMIIMIKIIGQRITIRKIVVRITIIVTITIIITITMTKIIKAITNNNIAIIIEVIKNIIIDNYNIYNNSNNNNNNGN